MLTEESSIVASIPWEISAYANWKPACGRIEEALVPDCGLCKSSFGFDHSPFGE